MGLSPVYVRACMHVCICVCLCVCICVCVCMCLCMCVHAHVLTGALVCAGVYVEATGWHRDIFTSYVSTRSLMCLELFTWVTVLGQWEPGSACVQPHPGLGTRTATPSFYMGSESELRSPCLSSKHITHWAILLAAYRDFIKKHVNSQKKSQWMSTLSSELSILMTGLLDSLKQKMWKKTVKNVILLKQNIFQWVSRKTNKWMLF